MYLFLLRIYYLLQLSFHSVAVVLKLVTDKNKYTLIKQYKNTINTVRILANHSQNCQKTPHYQTKTYTPTHY